MARNVRRLRQDRGWTQEQLAERAGISSVGMIEAGRRPGRVSTLAKIAEALGVGVAELFYDPTAERPAELEEFLSSPMGADTTIEEQAALMSLHVDGFRLTASSYQIALLMIRSAEREDHNSAA